MRKILAASFLLISGCAVVKSEPNLNETVALGEGCAVNVQADSYQVACTSSDPAKVVKAIQSINTKRKDVSK